MRYFSAGAGAAAAAVGILHLIAWLAGIMTYREFHFITMKTNSALCVTLLGTALVLGVFPGAGMVRVKIAQFFSAIVFLLAGLTLLQLLGDWDFGIDQMLAKEAPGAIGALHPNRMGPPPAVSLMLGGVALLFLLPNRRSMLPAAQWCGIAVFTIGVLAVMGYLYGVTGLFGAARYTAIAWPTAVAVLLLGTGIMFARPQAGFVARMVAPDPGGAAVRRLLPAAFLIPIVLGWLRLLGESRGLYDTSFGTSILILSWITIFSFLVYRVGAWVSRSSEETRRIQTLLLEAERLSSTGAWEWDLKTGLWTFSDEWLSIHGTASRRLAPEELLSIAHPDDRETIRQAFEDLRNGLSGYDLEHRIIRQDNGETCIVRARGQFVKDREGEVVRVYGFVRDITEAKLAEEELRRSRERLNTALENLRDGVMMATEKGKVFYWNPAALRMHGFADTEEAIRPPEYFNRTFELRSTDRRLLPFDEWPILKILRGEPVHDLEIFVLRPELRTERIISYSGTELKTASGERLLFLTLHDLTEQRSAERALRESEAKFRALFQFAAVGMGRVRFSDARWIDVNPAFCLMLGYSAEEMLSLPWTEITHPDDLELDLVPFRRMAGGEIDSYTVEKRFIHRDGHPVWTRLTLSLVRNTEGEPDYEIAVIEDISERKLAEEALRKAKEELEIRVEQRTAELRRESEERVRAVEELRHREHLLIQQSRLAAMGEMLVNISHQWRQPLNLLGLILQDLDRAFRRGGFTAEYLDANVGKAMQVIEHMSRTIDDFRNFFIPDKATRLFSVREVVETTLSMIRDSWKDINPELRIEVLDDVSVQGYRNEYAQVVMNILSNARDVFRERKVVTPRIAVKIFGEAGRSIVTIADNAGGIAPDVIDKVFDPYFTTKEPDKGTGIGLFMSKTIIEKNMKGSLTVRNTDQGAEFRIEV